MLEHWPQESSKHWWLNVRKQKRASPRFGTEMPSKYASSTWGYTSSPYMHPSILIHYWHSELQKLELVVPNGRLGLSLPVLTSFTCNNNKRLKTSLWTLEQNYWVETSKTISQMYIYIYIYHCDLQLFPMDSLQLKVTALVRKFVFCGLWLLMHDPDQNMPSCKSFLCIGRAQ